MMSTDTNGDRNSEDAYKRFRSLVDVRDDLDTMDTAQLCWMSDADWTYAANKIRWGGYRFFALLDQVDSHPEGNVARLLRARSEFVCPTIHEAEMRIALSPLLCPNIEHVNIGTNHMSAREALDVLSQCPLDHITSLRLVFADNTMEPWWRKTMYTLLRRCTRLEHLDASAPYRYLARYANGSYRAFEDNSGANGPLRRMLACVPTTLRSFGIEKLDDRDGEHIVDLLHEYAPQLECLHIRSYEVGTVVKRLCGRPLPSLHTLVLDDNKYVTRKVLERVAHMSDLQHLSLRRVDVDVSYLRELVQRMPQLTVTPSLGLWSVFDDVRPYAML